MPLNDQNLTNAFYIAGLIHRLREDGHLPTTEEEELRAWIMAHKNHENSYQEITDREQLSDQLQTLLNYDTDHSIEEVFHHLELKLPAGPVPIRNRKLWQNMAAACISTGIILSGVYFFYNKNSTRDKEPTYMAQDVPPGRNKAILTLSDGNTITLDKETPPGIAPEGIDINLSEGKVTYPQSKLTSALEYNTISIPKSGQYQLVLSDGSKVWLNSQTTLKFPKTFKNNLREVELHGEAYFEIKKDKAPFIVQLNNMQVQVLGTHFNVKAYPDENNIKTTLLEGSVKLISGNTSAILKPGKEGVFQEKQFTVNDASTEEAVAWKKGYFLFDKCDIQTIMQQFQRWYDIDVVYEGKVPHNRFVGEFKRNLSLNQALKILAQSGIQFKISDNKITIQSN